MCGFFSTLASKNIEPNNLETFFKVSKFIKHRGPDDSYNFKTDNYLSIFYRLSIRDLSIKSRQPIKSKCGRYILSFNGEIYRFKGLSRTEIKSFSSDTLCLLDQISKNGIGFVNNITGMFAISVFDIKDNLLYLIRDHLGIKPLYYISNNVRTKLDSTYFLSCSEQLPLIKLLKNNVPDINECLRFLKMGVSGDTEATFFEDIKQVKPGVILKIDAQDFSREEIKLKKNIDNIPLHKKGQFSASAHSKFLTQNLEDHLISDVPISSALSGGVDSTYIASTTAQLLDREINCFTLKSDLFPSEIDNKSDIHKLTKINLKIVESNYFSYQEKIKEIVQKLSAPFLASWIHQDTLFQHIANEKEYKVVLVGEGADEIYSGYKRLVYPYLLCLENDFENELFENSLNQLSMFLNLRTSEIIKRYKSFKKYLNSKNDYEDFSYRKYFKMTDRNMDYERYFPRLEDNEQFSDPEIFYKSHLLKYLTRADIPAHLHILDHISMSYGLELRVPFLDIDLVSEVFEYSYKYHFLNGFNKFMLRKVSLSTPDSIRYKRKKIQRPGPTQELMYNFLKTHFLKLLSKQNPLLNTQLIKNDFEISLKHEDKSISILWFRIYTFLVFWEIYFV